MKPGCKHLKLYAPKLGDPFQGFLGAERLRGLIVYVHIYTTLIYQLNENLYERSKH